MTHQISNPSPRPGTAELTRRIISSPLGDLFASASESALHAILWGPFDTSRVSKPLRTALGTAVDRNKHALLDRLEEQLAEYFEGRRQRFDIPIQPSGTAFQLEVWQALTRIPYAQTRSYTQQAHAIGRPRAVRAVGTANGANPISIVVPCHRVIGAKGALTGFAGGIENKRRLLALEARTAMPG